MHICKSFNRQVLDCEVESCREFMAMATGRECLHLEGVKHFKPQEPPPLLQFTSIDEMFQKGLISSSTKQDCSKLNQQATQDRTTCVYQVFFWRVWFLRLWSELFSVHFKSRQLVRFWRDKSDTRHRQWEVDMLLQMHKETQVCLHLRVNMLDLPRETTPLTGQGDGFQQRHWQSSGHRKADNINSVQIKKNSWIHVEL